MLVKLAVIEPGENCEGEAFWPSKAREIPGWELPASWVSEVPRSGYFTTTYYSGADAGCVPDFPARKGMLSLCLLGTVRI